MKKSCNISNIRSDVTKYFILISTIDPKVENLIPNFNELTQTAENPYKKACDLLKTTLEIIAKKISLRSRVKNDLRYKCKKNYFSFTTDFIASQGMDTTMLNIHQ